MSGHTDNTVIINAPLDLVWEMTNDIAAWPNLFSEYEAAEIVQPLERGFLFRLTMHPDENGIRWSWVSRREPVEAERIVRSHRVETGPFKYMSLFWEYTELVEGGTALRWVQDFEMKPQAPATDEQMTAHLNKNTAIQMDLIRTKVEAAALERLEPVAR